MDNGRRLGRASLRRQRMERFLNMLGQHQPISRTELAALAGMSPASVTRLVSGLSALGLVREVSVMGSAGRGRRAINLHTFDDGLFALGFHVAPDGVRGRLMDFDHRVRGQLETPLRAGSTTPEQLAEVAGDMARRLLPADPTRVRAAGVSVSGQIDRDTGRVARSEAFDWTDVDLLAAFGAALGMPVWIENDVKACLTWECLRRGYLASQQDVAYLYLGRAGIGFANMAGGRLVRGATNAAGEIEDVPLSMDDRLSDHLMEDSLVARARRHSPGAEGLEDILTAYGMGLPWARMLVDDFANHLNLLLRLVFALLDPGELILGGDIADALRGCPGLIHDERCAFGENYEDACANGVAFIAMREAVLDMTDDLSEAD